MDDMTKTQWTRERIVALPTNELQAITLSTNPATLWSAQVEWARQELQRRVRRPMPFDGKPYDDRLLPEGV